MLSTLFPQVGSYWYGLCLLSPLAGYYYLSKGTRVEQARVKLAASDDETLVDITIEADSEEIERFVQEMKFVEKGKVRVKGILERD